MKIILQDVSLIMMTSKIIMDSTIEVNLRKQKELDTEPKTILQIEFVRL